jgi:hypothetical protein
LQGSKSRKRFADLQNLSRQSPVIGRQCVLGKNCSKQQLSESGFIGLTEKTGLKGVWLAQASACAYQLTSVRWSRASLAKDDNTPKGNLVGS